MHNNDLKNWLFYVLQNCEVGQLEPDKLKTLTVNSIKEAMNRENEYLNLQQKLTKMKALKEYMPDSQDKDLFFLIEYPVGQQFVSKLIETCKDQESRLMDIDAELGSYKETLKHIENKVEKMKNKKWQNKFRNIINEAIETFMMGD